MNTRKYNKNLSKDFVEKLGYPANPTRLKRMKFLITAFEIQEQDPNAQMFVTGKTPFAVDSTVKHVNSMK